MSLNSNLVAYWKLEDVNDYTANNNDLTNNNTVSFATDGIIAKGGTFARASSQSLSIADASQTGLDITGDMSISLWTKFATLNANTLLSKFGAAGNRSWRISQGETNEIELDIYNSTDTAGAGAWPSLSLNNTGTWYHVVIVYTASANSATLYLNNVDKGAKNVTVTDIKNSSADFVIGATGSSPYTSFLDGMIDEVGVWNSALSTADVAVLYNAGAGQQPPFPEGNTSNFFSIL